MLFNICILGLAAVAAAMPFEASIQKRQEVTYTNGGCSTVDQLCYLSADTSWPCDQQSGACSLTNNICTFASSNVPGSNEYATGMAHCT